ncbi:MAG: hypothetical protein MJE77_32785 [Proteobacteria bacterium]|nr:hypothetical protein [Pseudomonadota bacterium]
MTVTASMRDRQKRDGRVFEPEIVALSRPAGAAGRAGQPAHPSRVEILAPAVGMWRGGPPAGTLIRPGDSLGEIEVLGVLHRLVAPQRTHGVVIASSDAGDNADLARRPVSYGLPILVVDAEATGHIDAGSIDGKFSASEDSAENGGDDAARLVFRAPTSGRYYGRPGPDKPPFVSVGDEIAVGSTVCLLEVMKTFNRIAYGGAGVPDRARVVAIAPSEEDDLAAGDPILYLE